MSLSLCELGLTIKEKKSWWFWWGLSKGSFCHHCTIYTSYKTYDYTSYNIATFLFTCIWHLWLQTLPNLCSYLILTWTLIFLWLQTLPNLCSYLILTWTLIFLVFSPLSKFLGWVCKCFNANKVYPSPTIVTLFDQTRDLIYLFNTDKLPFPGISWDCSWTHPHPLT